MNVISIEGTPITPIEKITGTANPQGISEATYTNGGMYHAMTCLITVEDGPANYAYSAADLAAGKGHPLYKGDVLRLNSYAQIKGFLFVNADVANPATIKVSAYF